MFEYLVSIATYTGFFMLLALALNVQWGLTGMANFGIAGFYALGAYASAILTVTYGWPIWGGFAAAGFLGLLGGLLVAALSLRLSGHFLAITTLGFAEIIRLIALNEDWLTNGPRGFPIPVRPFAGQFTRTEYGVFYLALVAAAVLVVFVAAEQIRRAPMGRTLRAIRDDDVVASVLGKNVFAFRIKVFGLGGLVMGIAGALYGHYTQNISPDHFMPMIAIIIWMAVILGGAGNNKAILLGAGIVTFIFEGSRFVGNFVPGLEAQAIAPLRIILIGTLLILIIRFRPEGVIPEEKMVSKRFE